MNNKRNILRALTGTLAAAAFAACLSFPASAAGWTRDTDGMRWYNWDEKYSSSMWKNGTDGEERWLGADGRMAVSCWVRDGEKMYYVDADGKRCKNRWLLLKAPQGEKNQGNGPFWYYFGPTGKRMENRWQEYEGKKYYLGATGAMETGWILDRKYYTNEDGAAVNGIQTVLSPEGVSTVYYFNGRGKKYVPDDMEAGQQYKIRKIDGKRYCFRADGSIVTSGAGDDGGTTAEYTAVAENLKGR